MEENKIVPKNLAKLYNWVCKYKGRRIFFREIYKYMYKQKDTLMEYKKKKSEFIIC